jgi:hypothetical protein
VGLKIQLAFWRAMRTLGIGTVWEVKARAKSAGASVVEEAHRIANGKGE